MAAFIMRDRNHASVIMWSTGNEIVERGGLGNGYEMARQLVNYVRSLDHTRPVTNAICSMWNGLNDEDTEHMNEEFKRVMSGGGSAQNANVSFIDGIWDGYTKNFVSCLDVVGYNYLFHRYEKDGQAYPERVICGTESFPMSIDKLWAEVERLPHVIGDFNWTSFDYIGEAGIGRGMMSDTAENTNEVVQGTISSQTAEYPWRLAYDADFDICGFERPQLAYRKIVWGSTETYIAVKHPADFGKKETVSYWGWPNRVSHWTWNGFEGKPVFLDVYSAAEEVELFLNGQSLGKKAAGKENRFTAIFEITYEPGELCAVSLANGKETSRHSITTARKAASVKLTADKTELNADGHSLAYITAEIIDEKGDRVPDCEAWAAINVEGAAALLGFGSGKPKTTENYATGMFTAHEGRLMAVVRAGYGPGEVRVTVTCVGLNPGEAVLTVKS
jgi:beta-galactosidase